ncbi:Uncharacterised protein [Vibrio cholerae]|uniref:Uncharacterized protein n=1 Tax=Vibrio cholerae TaxID=666 RepID=A0A655Y006_VIBCL|nr:Uncharacterised protein [Vibrio cholerae]
MDRRHINHIDQIINVRLNQIDLLEQLGLFSQRNRHAFYTSKLLTDVSIGTIFNRLG